MHPLGLLHPDPAATARPATANPRLVRAAHEFEAQMMKELLQPMTADDPLSGEDDGAGLELGSGSGSGGALSDFASEALGQALSQRGGFGIADSIVRELTRTNSSHRAAEMTEKVTGSPRRNTVMKKFK